MIFRPKASEVLTAYLKQVKEPPWTSYFVKYSSVVNDQLGKSHFNWYVGNSNYHILRTGCFPYIKYHCTKRPHQDLSVEDTIMGAIKVINLGIPTVMYGVAATFLITHKEPVYFKEVDSLKHNIRKAYSTSWLKKYFCKFANVFHNFIMPPKGKKVAAKKKAKSESSDEHDAASLSESSDSDSGKKSVKSKNNVKVPVKPNVSANKRNAKRGAKEEPPSKKPKVDAEKPQLNDLCFDCEKTTVEGEKWNMKISTWNVAGLRAWVKKSGIDYVLKEDPDIICLQETKCSEKKLPAEAKISGYHMYSCDSKKEGYAGVSLYSKEKPIKVKYGLGIKEHDAEGRAITAEYEKFYLVATYVPNAGQGLKTLPKRMKWDEDFRNYLKDLDSKKPVILCGDLNVAHNPIDLANPKTNTKSAGFTQEERDNMTELLKQGFIDTFRHLYPEATGAYTYWTFIGNARSRNTGWRLDYFVLSERLLPNLCDNVIRSKVYGSDHCPITLFLHI